MASRVVDEPDYEVVASDAFAAPNPNPNRTRSRGVSGAAAAAGDLDPKEADESFNLKFDAFKQSLQERYALEPTPTPAPAPQSASPLQPGAASAPSAPVRPYEIRVDASAVHASASAAASASAVSAAAGGNGLAVAQPVRLQDGGRTVEGVLPQIEGSSGSGAHQIEGFAYTEPGPRRDHNETGMDAFELQKAIELKDEDFQEKKKNDREAKRRRIKKRLERWNTTLKTKYPILHWMEEKTGINKVYLVCAAILVLFGMAFFGLGMNHLSDLIGFTYPVFRSYKCLEKPNESRDELRYWLVYWIVFGLFGTIEAMTDTLLSWVPFYYPIKLGFLMWCFLPSSKGAQSVYDAVIRPTLVAHESKIDGSLDSVRAAAGRSVSAVGSGVARSVRSKSIQISEALKAKFVEAASGGGARGAGESPLPATPESAGEGPSPVSAGPSAPSPSPPATPIDNRL